MEFGKWKYNISILYSQSKIKFLRQRYRISSMVMCSNGPSSRPVLTFFYFILFLFVLVLVTQYRNFKSIKNVFQDIQHAVIFIPHRNMTDRLVFLGPSGRWWGFPFFFESQRGKLGTFSRGMLPSKWPSSDKCLDYLHVKSQPSSPSSLGAITLESQYFGSKIGWIY